VGGHAPILVPPRFLNKFQALAPSHNVPIFAAPNPFHARRSICPEEKNLAWAALPKAHF
jgi:hypothetical protein